MPPEHFMFQHGMRNFDFDNWRLGQSLVRDSHSIELADVAWGTSLDGTAFVVSLQNSYHNHLFQIHDHTFFLSAKAHDVLTLNRIDLNHDANATVQPVIDVDVQPLASQDRLCPTAVAVTATMQSAPLRLILSSGQGDLHLLCFSSPDGSGADPLKFQCHVEASGAMPQEHQHPISVQAVAQTGEGAFKIAAWKWLGQVAASEKRQACQVVILHARVECGRQLHLQQTAVLQVAPVPPQLVLMDPHSGAVLVAAMPDDACTASHQGSEHIGLGAATSATFGGAGQEDGDEDEMDRDLLRQAAARLAQYTSAKETSPSQAPPVQPWADLYREGGPSGEGELENESSCMLNCYLPPQQPSTPGNEDQVQRPSWQMSLEPYRLLTTCSAEGQATSALLGLAEDVDCGVVQVTLNGTPQVQHQASIPALAYVAAGKQQRRHLLLAQPGSGLAAVLVEQHKFCFVYQAVAAGERTGTQQVVQLDAVDGERVVGASLLQMDGRHVVLVLTNLRLHSLVLFV